MARYIYPGKAKVVFAPAVANLAAPSGAEITAGTVLTVAGSTSVAGMKEMAGWETAGSTSDTPDVANTVVSNVPGMVTMKEASAEFYDDDAATPAVRTALAEGTAGYMIIMPVGQTTGRRCEVWPCKVITINQSDVKNDATPASFKVMFALTGTPNKVAVVP